MWSSHEDVDLCVCVCVCLHMVARVGLCISVVCFSVRVVAIGMVSVYRCPVYCICLCVFERKGIVVI